MTDWSLSVLLSGLQVEDIQQKLAIARKSFAHPPGTKGDASEHVWLEMLQAYLPQRYQAASAHIVDSHGKFSDQIDVVVFDRQYSPFIFKFQGQTIVPAESVYAAFEAKQAINAAIVEYAQKKVASVRRLHRTSLPIPHAGGTYPAKPLIPILGGLLTFESDWSPAFGEPLERALDVTDDLERLEMGCVAAHGHFTFDPAAKTYAFTKDGLPGDRLPVQSNLHALQFSGTVPMIDIRAYARTGCREQSGTRAMKKILRFVERTKRTLSASSSPSSRSHSIVTVVGRPEEKSGEPADLRRR